MAWWVIRNLKTGDNYSSDVFPLKAVVEAVSITDGHILAHNEFEIVCGEYSADMRTGAIWKGDQLLATVPDADKLVLFKRIKRDGRSGSIVSEIIYLGLAHTFDGQVVKIQDGNHQVEPFLTGIPIHGN